MPPTAEPAIPPRMIDFIREHHVVSLATCHAGVAWAASCFYAFDPLTRALLILSSPDTLHGVHMLANPHVAGTICGQPEGVREIRGMQFSAVATPLQKPAADAALQIYFARHPIARLHRAQIWRLQLTQLKFTDNRLFFGQKTLWPALD
ncbi:YhbP family protein [Silvimonas sp. JCM 19000]